MTKDQLTGLYWETFRQEARARLNDINNVRFANAGKAAEDHVKTIEQQAFPYDPDVERDATEEDFKDFKVFFGALETIDSTQGPSDA